MPKGLIAIDGGNPEVVAPWAPRDVALLLVANRPLVHHAADTLRRAGAEEVIVVAEADTAAAIRELLGAGADALTFIDADGPPTAAGAILAAAPLIGEERCLLHMGNGMVVGDHAVLAKALADEGADAAVFFHDAGEAEPRLTGVHAFGPRFMDVLRGCDGGRVSDAVERLADAGGRVQGGVLNGWWRHGGTAEDLLDVNRRVLDELPAAEDVPRNLDGARLEGRVKVHPTARVRGSVVRGPAIIGAHARVTDAYVGPYACIGDGAEIENAEIACSIVLPRARIRHVGVRVEDSIIGPGAEVGRDFALPKSMRLLVGGGAQITLA